jgi:integrase/recombinase XerD
MQIFDIMYPNYRIVLDLRRPKNNGLFPVKIRVTLNRVQKYYSIGLDLNVSNFDRIQNGSVRKELRIYKNKIADWENRAKHIIHQMDTLSFEEFKSRLHDNRSVKVTDVYALFDQKIDKLKSQEKISTSSIYNDAKNSLKRFKSKLNLMDVTSDFLKNYESYMISEGRSVTTISIYIRSLRSIYNQAIDAEMVDRKYYPFGKNKYQPKAPRNIKKALTIEQIKSIIDYKVEEGSNQQLAKDMWLLSYYCNGMNIKDIINLKFKNIENDTIYFERLKTSSTNQAPKPIIVALIPEALEIIKRWKKKKRSSNDFVFPVLKKSMSEEEKLKVKNQFIKTINNYMKKIGTDIGYDKPLTTYAARHSYATILKRSGAPLGFISESLGHKSLQTTEAYLDSFEDDTRRKYAEMLVPK